MTRVLIDAKVRERLRTNFVQYAASCLKIRTKSGQIRPLQLNEAQLTIHGKIEQQLKEIGKVRAIVVKGRQQGCSTLIEARYFWKVTHRRGVRAFILTHEAEATKNLFDMARHFYNNCPPLLRPTLGASSATEMYFGGIDSGYRVGTAGNKGVGRSLTAQYLHASEAAYWPHAQEHAKGLLQAVPDQPGTEVIFESTGNGKGNYFHQLWLSAVAGESDYMPIFIPWFLQPEYRKQADSDMKLTDEEHDLAGIYGLDRDQILWRRHKISELTDDTGDGRINFMREYPMTADEAFEMSGLQTFISGHIVSKARSNFKKEVARHGPTLIGVDPARFGHDRTAIIRRQGRVAYKLETYHKLDTMQVTGLIVKAIKEENPTKVFIDVGGLGAGIVDRLRELGYGNKILAVNFGEKAYQYDRYINKRAEMWGKLREWLHDEPSAIPDDEQLAVDICAPQYSYDSKSRVQIEKKEDMFKRGIKSPDAADALCLTFAEPVEIEQNDNILDALYNPGISYI